MRVVGMGHTGITVKNLENSIEFYQGVLGFKVIHQPCDMVTDKEESRALGLPECVHRICLLEVTNGYNIELMEFGNATSPNPEPLPMNQIGTHHISLTVDNMSEWVKKLTDLKLEFLYKPLPAEMADGSTAWWALFKDPDGIIIELMQN